MIASSLRSRLLLSYVAVIFVCLVLVTLSLILVARPIQERLTTARLATQLTVNMPRVRTLLEQEQTPTLAIDALARWANRRDMRVLLLDRDGRVLGDTADEWTGRLLPQLLTGVDGEGRARGIAPAPDGSLRLYAAAPITSDLWMVLVASPPSAATGLFGDLGEGLLIAGAIALAFSVLLAALISRSVAGPTGRMAQAAEAIAAGNYDLQLEVHGPREVRTLAQSLEAMARQIKASQQSMHDLVVNVSHDLRTPLTSVQGFAQALMEGVAQDEEARRHAAGIIYEEASRMVRMVEQLTDLALIESGQLKLVRCSLDSGALLAQVIEALRPAAQEKGIALTADLTAASPIKADHDRLVQVFTNLIGNALKYTPQGGRVQVNVQRVTGSLSSGRHGRSVPQRGASDKVVRVESDLEWLVVSVTDSGCGIPAEDLPRIFERFYQVDKARTVRQGYGLGLAITREIVEAHGGHIWVESLEGLGSRFTVELPVSEVPALADC